MSTCLDNMFQNNLLNIGACSLKIKKVILRGPKDICLSRRCVRLKWHVPPYLWRLLRTEAASAFFAALAASAFLGCIRPMEGKWQRLSETWKLDFPWLDIKQGPFRLGCQICHEAGVKSKWGMFSVTAPSQMQRISFQRHQKKAQHREAACGQKVVCAPAADVIEKIVSDIQNGTPTCSSIFFCFRSVRRFFCLQICSFKNFALDQ